MKYSEWREKFVDGNKDGSRPQVLTNGAEDGIIKAETNISRQGYLNMTNEKGIVDPAKTEAVPAQSVLNRNKTQDIIKQGIESEKPIFDNGILGNRALFFKPEDGFYDVVLHGDPETVYFYGEKIDSHTLAKIIKGRSDYHGEPIRLLSCNTGRQGENKDCFAQRLANELKAEVKAPNNILWAHRIEGGISKISIGDTAYDDSGKFVTFLPHFK